MLTTEVTVPTRLDVPGIGQPAAREGPLVPPAGQAARVVDDAVDGVHGGSGQPADIAGGAIVQALLQGAGRKGGPQAAAVCAAGGVPRLAGEGDALRPAPVRAGAGEAPPVAGMGGGQVAAYTGGFVADLHARDSSRERARETTGRSRGPSTRRSPYLPVFTIGPRDAKWTQQAGIAGRAGSARARAVHVEGRGRRAGSKGGVEGRAEDRGSNPECG